MEAPAARPSPSRAHIEAIRTSHRARAPFPVTKGGARGERRTVVERALGLEQPVGHERFREGALARLARPDEQRDR